MIHVQVHVGQQTVQRGSVSDGACSAKCAVSVQVKPYAKQYNKNTVLGNKTKCSSLHCHCHCRQKQTAATPATQSDTHQLNLRLMRQKTEWACKMADQKAF